MQKGIDVVWCQVSDMSRAVAFYRDVLGFPCEEETPYWSSLKVNDSLMIGLHPNIGEDKGRRSGWSITIPVDDILAGKAALEAAGAKVGGFEDIEGYAVLLSFDDLDGNPLQLAQRGATKASLGIE
jgi:predicted enzyme related to lactoylglutathione lyase